MEDAREINQLIRELNLGGEGEARPESERLDGWLGTLVARAGSDLLVAGAPAAVRLDGRVTPLAEAPLSGDEIEDAVLPSLSSAARSRYLQDGAADASYRVRGLVRFRINLHHERGRAAATVRALPSEPPPAGRRGLAPVLDLSAAVREANAFGRKSEARNRAAHPEEYENYLRSA